MLIKYLHIIIYAYMYKQQKNYMLIESQVPLASVISLIDDLEIRFQVMLSLIFFLSFFC